MGFSYNLIKARTSSAGNPITTSITCAATDSVMVVMIKGQSANNRAGGSPTWGAFTLTQANSTQKAAVSPEASAELWYLLNPGAATNTLTIPNTGAITCFYTVVSGRVAAGASGGAYFILANGGNNTSTNPTPGAIWVPDNDAILFAITAGGWTTWAPSAQAGTIIANTDDGADGGGEQYLIQATPGSVTMSWTFGTSDDWGAVAAAFGTKAPPVALNNYMFPDTVTGMSVSEKIR